MTKKLILDTLDDVKRLARALCIQLQILVCDLRLLQLKSQRFFLNRKIDVAYAKFAGDTAEVFRLQLFRLMMMLFKVANFVFVAIWVSLFLCRITGMIFTRCTASCWNVHIRLLFFSYFPFRRY